MATQLVVAGIGVHLGLATPCLAHRQVTPWDQSPVRLSLPDLAVHDAAHRPTAEEEDEIASLIASLRPVQGRLANGAYERQQTAWLFGLHNLEDDGLPLASCIAPMAGDWSLMDCEAAWRLITLGPKAMPALLAALDDATPVGEAQGIGGSHIGNPDDSRPVAIGGVSARELRIIDDALPAVSGLEWVDATLPICRGDLCLVVLGQIVNRHYPRWDHRWQLAKSASAVHSPKVAAVIRTIWASDNPARLLMTSLLDDVRRGGRFSARAVERLAFYFPEEAGDALAKEIASGRQSDAFNAWLKDGTLVAVGARPSKPVLDALVTRLESASSAEEVAALIGPALAATAPELLLRQAIATAPLPCDGFYDPAPGRLLSRVLRHVPEGARAVFEAAASSGSADTRRVSLGVLALAESAPEWLEQFVAPMLDDRAPTGSMSQAHGILQPLRVCDLAARVLARRLTELHFDDSVGVEARDRQIEVIQEHVRFRAEGGAAAAICDSFEPIGEALVVKPEGRLTIPRQFTRDRVVAMDLDICGQGDPMVLTIDMPEGTVRRTPLLVPPGTTVALLDGLRTAGDGPTIVADGEVRSVDPQDGRTTALPAIALPPDPGSRSRNGMVAMGDALLWIDKDDAVWRRRVEDGTDARLWAPDGPGEHGDHRSLTLVRVSHPDRVVVSFFPFEERPALLIDVASGAVSTLDGLPEGGWGGGSGPFLWNNMNSRLVVWDILQREPVAVPARDPWQLVFGDSSAECVVAYALERDGQVAVVDLAAQRRLATLSARTASSAYLVLSHDMHTLLRVESICDGGGPPDAVHIVAWDVSAWAHDATR